jgi:hypothetical protein
VVMVLLTRRHMEIDVYDVVNIDKVKKWVMKYHSFEDTILSGSSSV